MSALSHLEPPTWYSVSPKTAWPSPGGSLLKKMSLQSSLRVLTSPIFRAATPARPKYAFPVMLRSISLKSAPYPVAVHMPLKFARAMGDGGGFLDAKEATARIIDVVSNFEKVSFYLSNFRLFVQK